MYTGFPRYMQSQFPVPADKRRLTGIYNYVALFVCSPALYVWQFSTSCIKYFNYPVNTRTVQYSAQAMDFPAVTFCNMNPMRRYAVESDTGVIRKTFNVSLWFTISSTLRFGYVIFKSMRQSYVKLCLYRKYRLRVTLANYNTTTWHLEKPLLHHLDTFTTLP